MDKISGEGSEASDNIAELRARAEVEPIASFLGLSLLEMTPGYAKVAMKMLPEYKNFQGLIFGGIVMAVADYAFAYSGNSLVFPSVASQFNMHLIAAPQVGDELIAECWVVKGGRRVVIVEMTVTNQEGKLVAKGTATGIPVNKVNR